MRSIVVVVTKRDQGVSEGIAVSHEIWVKANRRALGIAAIALGVPALATLALLLWHGAPLWLRILSGCVLVLAAVLLSQLGWFARHPRLSRSGDEFLLFLRGTQPLRIPVEVVECFFRGQAPLTVTAKSLTDSAPVPLESVNIVMRLADRSFFFHQREVSQALGKWCDGYITLTGTACEPITPELLLALNRRLAEIHRERQVPADMGAVTDVDARL